MIGSQEFSLRLGLGHVDPHEAFGEIEARLQALAPIVSKGATGLELSLTITAEDIWLAVLVAMTVLTDLGYPVVRVDARPH